MVFSGTVKSDYLKLATIKDINKTEYINFAGTDFYSWRDSVIKYLKAVYPLDYNSFIESDMGMMLIEALSAYLGAVMSHKADMLAQENFLATAKQRSSVKKLLELVGVRMKGPISATANVKLTMQNIVPADDLEFIDIPASERVITVPSPEDGGELVYTLYKVQNGLIADYDGGTSIKLYRQEANNAAKSVYTNLVLQEGTLVIETGAFTTTEGIKTINLNQAPVIEGSVAVFIYSDNPNVSGAYTEVENTYFASGDNDKVFQLAYGDDYDATIIFGDGTLGSSPGINDNYAVSYRIGGGSRGNIPKGYISTELNVDIAGTDDTASLINISQGTGGSEAETLEHAKQYAPLTFRRQDRVVTLADYIAFANTFMSSYGTVGKATAVTRDAFSSANIVDLYVLEKASDLQFQKATTTFKINLLTAINKKKMLTTDVVIVDGLIRTIDLVVEIKVDRGLEPHETRIKSLVRNKIVNFFKADNMEFGKNFVLADLNRHIFELDEVRYSTVLNLDDDVEIDMNEIIQLNNFTINIVYV